MYSPNLDLLGIGQNVFTMTRKEGHMSHCWKKLESLDATSHFQIMICQFMRKP